MNSRFTSEFFAGNRQRLRELFTGTAPIAVAANGLLQRGADTAYKFSQDANFWYLTGLDEPDLVLVMDRDKEYLIVPERSSSREAFDGSVDHSELTTRSGVKQVYAGAEGWDVFGKRVAKVKHVATAAVPPSYVEHYGIYTNPARAETVKKIKEINSEIELLDIGPHLARLRMIKQQPELDALQAAIDITIKTLREILKPARIKKYGYEYEIEAELSRGFRQRDADGHAFEPIVAGGARACVLHNINNSGRLAADELLLIDTGAEVDHYAADITRTYALGTPSRRQEIIHSTVVEIQDYAISLLRPGVLLRDYEDKIEHFMGEKMRELGLIKTISHEEVRRFYPHSTSHFLGLNAHDVGDYERPLEPGTVITVEPGIYIPDEGIGVRLEDNILITATGTKNLSAKLSRRLGV